MKVWGHIASCLKSGGACALVTVTRVEGSTPREQGARMVVRPDGGFFGTIGGGTLEFEVIRTASKRAANGVLRLDLQMMSLGPDLGQCCGGRAQVAIEVLTIRSLTMAQQLDELEKNGGSFSTRSTVIDGIPSSREVIDRQVDSPFELAQDAENATSSLTERFGSDYRPIYLFGAGHVSKALVLALAPLPFSVRWIDSRMDQFPGAVPANVTKIHSLDPPALLSEASADSFVLAMTHSHALDEEIMARALLLQKFSYCGVIGSKTKRARFQKRLKSRGLTDSLISEMTCPIGVAEIKSKQPAVIAAGITVEMLKRDEARFQQTAAGERLAQR